MSIAQISTQYAKALLTYSIEQNQAAEVYSITKFILKVYEEVPHLKDILHNPDIDNGEKMKALKTASGENSASSLMKIFELILKNHRELNIQSILLRFIELYRDHFDIRHVKYITAMELNEGVDTRLREKLKAKLGGTIELETEIDPNIIGGYILQIEDYRWDASVKGQLQSIKKNLSENKVPQLL